MIDDDNNDPCMYLDLKVEELIKELKTTWEAKSIGYDYEYRVDFDEEVEGSSREEVISLMLDKMISHNQGHAEDIYINIRHTIQIPVLDTEYGIWEFKEFTNIQQESSISRYDILSMPEWQKKVEKAAKEKAAAEKAKKEAEQQLWAEEARRRDLATYERIKKELESKNNGTA